MMTKEQFFTFKSDMKKGMRIARLNKSHRKGYWNDGFATQKEQDEAIRKDALEIEALQKTMCYCIHCDSPIIHWAYYCAKHSLDKEAAIQYLKSVRMQLYSEDYLYRWHIEPILRKYEETVCSDRQ